MRRSVNRVAEKSLRVVAGVAIWAVALIVLWRLAFESPTGSRALSANGAAPLNRGAGHSEAAAKDATGGVPPAQQRMPAKQMPPGRLAETLWSYVAGPYPEARLEFDRPTLVAVGDPLFVRSPQGGFEQIGEIRSVDPAGAEQRKATLHCQALFYPTAPPLSPDASIVHYRTPQSMAWVLETMLPPEKRSLIADEIQAAYERHHEEVLAALRPVIDASLRDAFVVIEDDLPAALGRRRDRFEKLAARYEKEVIDAEIVPLVKREIWPILREYAEPAVEDVGKQMLDRLSLWAILWRAGADQIPFTRQNLLDEEMKRFLREEAVPLLESRTDEFVTIQKKVLAEAANNKRVQAAVKKNVKKILNDPELQTLLWEIVGEVVLHNPRLHAVLDKHWTSPQAKQAFQIAASRLEPTVRRIGDLLFGTRENGLSPEFNSVLRNQVLGKDKRWFIVSPSAGSSSADSAPFEASADDRRFPQVLSVRAGGEPGENPFLDPANSP